MTTKPQEPESSRSATDAIVGLFRDGDEGATDLVRARIERIVTFRGFGMSRQDRSDLKQKVTVELWQAVNRPEFESARFWGFVETVTVRRCIDWLRARRRETSLESVPEPPDRANSSLDSVLEAERNELAHAALTRLPWDCRQLIVLHIGEKKTYRELETVLGKSEAALRVQMHRCIKRAQAVLRKMIL